MAQCFDANVVKITPDTKQTSRIYSFNFDKIAETDYIKLVFFVDYFRPDNFSPDQAIAFNLTLLSFGSPNYEAGSIRALKCDKYGTNYTAKGNPMVDEPNSCICNAGYGKGTTGKCDIVLLCAEKVSNLYIIKIFAFKNINNNNALN